MKQWLKDNHLVIVTTAGVCFSLVLILFVIEGLAYTEAKKELVRKHLETNINSTQRMLVMMHTYGILNAPGFYPLGFKPHLPGFIARLRQAGVAPNPTPAKRFWELLPPNQKQLAQKVLNNQYTERDMYRLIGGLDDVLRRRDFYQAALFKGVELPEEAREMLKRQRDGLSEDEVQQLNRWLLEAALPANIDTRETSRKKLAAAIEALIKDPRNTLFQVSITDADDRTLLSPNERDLAQDGNTSFTLKTSANNYRNCLLFRRFEQYYSTPINAERKNARGEIEEVKIGAIRWHCTTPRIDPRIERLTTNYRWGLLGVILLVSGAYFYFMRYAILPVRSVVSRIDRIETKMPQVLTRPRSELERRYNDLALNALLTAINRHMTGLLSHGGPLTKSNIYARLPEAIRENLQLVRAAFCEAGCEPGGALRRFRQLSAAPAQTNFEADSHLDAKRRGKLVRAVLREAKDGRENGRQCQTSGSGADILIVGSIAAAPDGSRAELIFCQPARGLSREMLEWTRHSLDRAIHQIRFGIEALELQKNMIVWEKRQASINLARNLGHDLTNIIATSKFDLLTVRKFLQQPDRDLNAPSRPKQLFAQSLEHLVHNTRFLQEIVNIYRAFSYVKHPRYEKVEVNQLLEEIVELFRLSTSSRIQLKTEFGKDLPPCNLEARLIKLALFNLLTNATQAIQRKPNAGDAEVVRVASRHLKKQDRVEIIVSDSGAGIRDKAGKALPAAEIETIFELGVSAKGDDEAGEGFGLSWVKTIVTEFHNGEITARNAKPGGAEFTIVLPVNLRPSDVVTIAQPVTDDANTP